MAPKFLSHLPGMRWIPHDIPSQDAPSKPKHKSRNPFSSSSRASPIRLSKSYTTISSSTAAAAATFDTRRTHAQSQSMFFARLPLELRTIVYEYVMGEETVHLTMDSKKRFGHFVCVEEGPCVCRVLVDGKEETRLDMGCAAVLRTCKRMYYEALPHLYRPHVFSILHLTHLLFLPTRLPQPNLDAIRTLRLRWAIRALPYLRRGPKKSIAYGEDTANWERGWGIIAGMKGLRDLCVVLSDPSPWDMWERSWLDLEELLLRPVKEVTGPGCFELVLPFKRCRTDWDMGESRVVLRRPEGGGEEDEDDN